MRVWKWLAQSRISGWYYFVQLTKINLFSFRRLNWRNSWSKMSHLLPLNLSVFHTIQTVNYGFEMKWKIEVSRNFCELVSVNVLLRFCNNFNWCIWSTFWLCLELNFLLWARNGEQWCVPCSMRQSRPLELSDMANLHLLLSCGPSI